MIAIIDLGASFQLRFLSCMREESGDEVMKKLGEMSKRSYL